MKLRNVFAAGAVALSLAAASALTAPPAQAIGCITGGIAGGIAGHYAGHHAVVGAIGGCIAGRHARNVQRRRAAEERAAAYRRSHGQYVNH